MRPAAGLLCLAFFSHPLALGSQVPKRSPGPLITDRPDQTESTSIVAPGFVQLEAGWTWEQRREGTVRLRTHTVPSLLARVGVSKRLEARLGFPGFQTEWTEDGEGVSGLADMELGFKYRVLTEAGVVPEVAVIAHLSLPTGASGLSSERADPSLLLAFSHSPAEGLALGCNLGWVWSSVSDGSGERAALLDLVYSFSLGGLLTERLGFFAESFGGFATQAGRADAHSLDGGLAYRLADNFQLDLSVGVGLSRAAPDWFLGAGAAARLPR